jgi:hypothetical protein
MRLLYPFYTWDDDGNKKNFRIVVKVLPMLVKWCKVLLKLVMEKSLAEDKIPVVGYAEFLQTYPSLTKASVKEFCKSSSNTHDLECHIIELWCSSEYCKDYRFFKGKWEHDDRVYGENIHRDTLIYTCRNCNMGTKVYSLAFKIAQRATAALVWKIGEYPPLHIEFPSNLSKLLGPDFKTFKKGLQSEKHEFGLGACSYYRRTIEDQWRRILSILIGTSQKLGVEEEKISILKEALKEHRFSKAVGMIGDAFPSSLLIDGQHNPMTILYSEFSKALHELPDHQCLESARILRGILSALAERITFALAEHGKLKKTLSDYFRTKSTKADNQSDENSQPSQEQ